MKYIVIPKEVIDKVPKEVLEERHLSPRRNKNGDAIIKVHHYHLLFPSILVADGYGDFLDKEETYPFPVYEGDELNELLTSKDWNYETVD